LIKANSPAEAKDKVREGQENEVSFEYHSTIDSSEWPIEEVKERK
jgi:hypothetical protein